MFDQKAETLLAIINAGSYTKAAKALSLTQPAVSHQVKLLEQEFGVKLFYSDRKELKLTEEGAILAKYARRSVALYNNALQALNDHHNLTHHLVLGMTPTVNESLVPQALALYCQRNPQIHINIFTDTINNIYDKLKSYEIDAAIVDGKLPDSSYSSVLLDTDYLCLIVSPQHPLAKRSSVALAELKNESFILRSSIAGTRQLFETYLESHFESIHNFKIMMEMDNLSTIKELVSLNMGISIIAYSACRDDELAGKLAIVPIENSQMIREINIFHHKDFSRTNILEELRKIYKSLR